jgi:hypothetical protein
MGHALQLDFMIPYIIPSVLDGYTTTTLRSMDAAVAEEKDSGLLHVALPSGFMLDVEDLRATGHSSF